MACMLTKQHREYTVMLSSISLWKHFTFTVVDTDDSLESLQSLISPFWSLRVKLKRHIACICVLFCSSFCFVFVVVVLYLFCCCCCFVFACCFTRRLQLLVFVLSLREKF